GAGLATAEGTEDLHRVAATAEGEDSVPEAPAGACDGRGVAQAGILEGAERVGRQDLGPFVAVVAGGVAAREDVAEAAQEAVLGERGNDGGVSGDALL